MPFGLLLCLFFLFVWNIDFIFFIPIPVIWYESCWYSKFFFFSMGILSSSFIFLFEWLVLDSFVLLFCFWRFVCLLFPGSGICGLFDCVLLFLSSLRLFIDLHLITYCHPELPLGSYKVYNCMISVYTLIVFNWNLSTNIAKMLKCALCPEF